jgi:hypothetical protein
MSFSFCVPYSATLCSTSLAELVSHRSASDCSGGTGEGRVRDSYRRSSSPRRRAVIGSVIVGFGVPSKRDATLKAWPSTTVIGNTGAFRAIRGPSFMIVRKSKESVS